MQQITENIEQNSQKKISRIAFQKIIEKIIKKHLKANNITAENFIFDTLKFKKKCAFSSDEQERHADELELKIMAWHGNLNNAYTNYYENKQQEQSLPEYAQEAFDRQIQIENDNLSRKENLNYCQVNSLSSNDNLRYGNSSDDNRTYGDLNRNNNNKTIAKLQDILSQKDDEVYGEKTELIKFNLNIDAKQYFGLGFFDLKNMPIPNLFLKSRIFCNYDKRKKPTFNGENLAHKNSNFNLFGYGKALSNDDYRKFLGTFALYTKTANFIIGETVTLKIKGICDILGMEYHGDNPKLILNTLQTLAQNRYVIEVYGKNRKQIIYKIGHKIPFHFIKSLKILNRKSIEIAFDPRYALLFCTLKNNLDGNIIYKTKELFDRNKKKVIKKYAIMQTSYGIFNTAFLQQNTKLKGFATNIYMQTLATNNFKQKIDLNLFKENYAYKSKIAQIKHNFKNYIAPLQNTLIKNIDEITANVFEFYGAQEKRERLIKYFNNKATQIKVEFEKYFLNLDKPTKNNKNEMAIPIEVKERLFFGYKKAILQIEKGLKRNGIDLNELNTNIAAEIKALKQLFAEYFSKATKKFDYTRLQFDYASATSTHFGLYNKLTLLQQKLLRNYY